MQLEPYLYFGGSCAQALELYETAFGGTTEIMHFKDAPPDENMPAVDPDGVMHGSFKAPGVAFMASDGRPGTEYTGGNVSMSIAGTIEPLAKMFWGATFGQLTDRYGIDWMFNLG